MSEEKRTCPACGSVVSADATQCDICGEDLQAAAKPAASPEQSDTGSPETSAKASDAPTPDEPSPAQAAEPTPPRSGSRQPSRRKKGSGKSAPSSGRGSSASGGALFTTPQWIMISISSLILGAVLTATFLPKAAETETPQQTTGTEGAAAPETQIDLQQLEQTRAYVESHPGDLDARLRYANDLDDARLYDQAIAQYKEYLEAVPDNPDARVDLGICYFNLKQYDAAIKEMERAVANHPEHQLGHFNLGIVNLAAGNREAAREWLTKARDLDPSSPYGQSAAQILKDQFAAGN